jgi:hypothetical protein
MFELSGQWGPVSMLHVLVAFGHADASPVHIRREQARLLHEFMDRALRATGNRPDDVERFNEGDGLLCAMPVETPVDGAVELLPESLARQLARHNRGVGEAFRLKAVLAFSCGPSAKEQGRLFGPGRDDAVAQADLEAVRAALGKAPPGTVVTVIDSGLFNGYVKPEFGQNLSPEDFTEIPGDPPAWFTRTHVPVRSGPALAPTPERPCPDAPEKSRRLLTPALLALAMMVLLAAGAFSLLR